MAFFSHAACEVACGVSAVMGDPGVNSTAEHRSVAIEPRRSAVVLARAAGSTALTSPAIVARDRLPQPHRQIDRGMTGTDIQRICAAPIRSALCRAARRSRITRSSSRDSTWPGAEPPQDLAPAAAFKARSATDSVFVGCAAARRGGRRVTCYAEPSRYPLPIARARGTSMAGANL